MYIPRAIPNLARFTPVDPQAEVTLTIMSGPARDLLVAIPKKLKVNSLTVDFVEVAVLSAAHEKSATHHTNYASWTSVIRFKSDLAYVASHRRPLRRV